MLVPGIVAALHGHIICGNRMALLSSEERCKIDHGVPGQCWSVKAAVMSWQFAACKLGSPWRHNRLPANPDR